MTLHVTPVAAFKDNYIWLIRRDSAGPVFVVDPGDARPVLDWLDRNNTEIAGILLTHHHPDHTGGVDELKTRYKAPVYGPDSSRIPQVTVALDEGDTVEVFGEQFRVIAVPGHTMDHIAFHAAPKDGPPLLFCGDTLFAAGCGRLFEGTPEVMYQSLRKLAKLPPETLVYCAHEYTMANLDFALAADPGNEQLSRRVDDEQRKLDTEGITLPSSLALELRTNPFLRCHNDSVRQQSELKSEQELENEISVFAALRKWKDNF